MRQKDFPRAGGRALDKIGRVLGVSRRRRLWIFRESDRSYRERLLAVLAVRNAVSVGYSCDVVDGVQRDLRDARAWWVRP